VIITRTPFRLSLFGGGTDYPAWFREHGGAVFGAAINKYCYLTLRELPPFFEHRHRIVYSKVETVSRNEDIQHPAVRGILKHLQVNEGLEIHHDADLPARSGIGSSSSFTVGLLNALHALRGEMQVPKELGKEAIRVEQDVIGEDVGCQDQVWAAFGGLNRIDFKQDGDFSVTPIVLRPERRKELSRSLMLVFTGFSRFASHYARSQIENLGKRQTELKTMQAMVDSALEIVCSPKAPLAELGRLLHESWRMKRKLADGISNNEIDDIYEAGLSAGALGGKLLGAGGGGFMVFFVEPSNEARDAVRQRLSKLIHVNFDFESEGSKIVLYQPNGF
jgi:D-glycero-alpha-D-manno-heptose-7-phosphate kinase